MTWPGHDSNLSCDAAHEQITLLLYGELSDEACHRLEQHRAGCADCRDELEVPRALSSAMAILPVREPSPNLIAQTRLKIDEALEQAPRDSWLAHFGAHSGQISACCVPRRLPQQPCSSPVWASASLASGLPLPPPPPPARRS